MNKKQEFYNKTESNIPRKNIEFFINNLKCEPGHAIELGCGAGNDTIYLIKHGWNVHAIDRENVKDRIMKRLNNEEYKFFRFSQQEFENVILEKNNLLVANFSLPFCNKNDFSDLWNKINDSIAENGYFVGNFFGVNDEWKKTKENMTFLSKDEVLKLFDDFEILNFKEIEEDKETALGEMKHWHLIFVMARKK